MIQIKELLREILDHVFPIYDTFLMIYMTSTRYYLLIEKTACQNFMYGESYRPIKKWQKIL